MYHSMKKSIVNYVNQYKDIIGPSYTELDMNTPLYILLIYIIGYAILMWTPNYEIYDSFLHENPDTLVESENPDTLVESENMVDKCDIDIVNISNIDEKTNDDSIHEILANALET